MTWAVAQFNKNNGIYIDNQLQQPAGSMNLITVDEFKTYLTIFGY